MGYADGYYYGQGRIICDTSTFSVGDTIRVRSMTDSNKVWNKTVATVGTALVFTVPCYDYYKICTVQDIGGTPTEIGGVYKTVDYGQTLFIGVADFNPNSLAYVQSVLNNHQENYVLNIGDEKTIKINSGGTPTDWTMQIANIDGTNHRVDFVSKDIYSLSVTANNYSSSTLRTNAQAFYNSIDNNDKQYIKEVTRTCRNNSTLITYSDYVWVAGLQEIVGDDIGCGQTQFPIFTTQSSRIKLYNGVANNWWTDDCRQHSSMPEPYYINPSGGYSTWEASDSRGFVPCFRLTADS